jgi:hypothetical protein
MQKTFFSKINIIILLVSVVTLIVGYKFLATGETNSFESLTIAPLILILTYFVLIPLGILWGKKDKETEGD